MSEQHIIPDPKGYRRILNTGIPIGILLACIVALFLFVKNFLNEDSPALEYAADMVAEEHLPKREGEQNELEKLLILSQLNTASSVSLEERRKTMSNLQSGPDLSKEEKINALNELGR